MKLRCGVYVHVPYCTRKCGYCAFHSRTRWTPDEEAALLHKIAADAATVAAGTGGERSPAGEIAPGFRPRASSLFIGGGTPSVLAPGALAHLVTEVTKVLGTPGEITCEANPDTADDTFLAEAAGAGVTRLSVGVQSLSSRLCEAIGRMPTSVARLERIRSGWEGPLSADLILGIPGQRTSDARNDIRRIVDMGFSHLSIYDLVIESETALYRAGVGSGGRITMDDIDWRLICADLADAGFIRYEVSNFALAGSESAHNIGYWRAEPYLGLGPSAVSTLPAGTCSVRITQPSRHERYLHAHPYKDGAREFLDEETLMTEFFMLGLRTAQGADLQTFFRRFGVRPGNQFLEQVSMLERDALLVRDAETIRPTTRGMDLLNHVLQRLLGVPISEANVVS